MATYKIHYNSYVDQETHPEITTKQSAIKIARSLTTNEVGDFQWEEEYKTLNFSEFVYAEGDTEEEAVLDNPKVLPQIKDADYAGVTKLRKPRK